MTNQQLIDLHNWIKIRRQAEFKDSVKWKGEPVYWIKFIEEHKN